MEYFPKENSPCGLSPLTSSQDFCLGAKPTFSPNVLSNYQDSFLNFDDQLNTSSDLCLTLDAFTDVILKDDTSTNLFFQELDSDIFPEEIPSALLSPGLYNDVYPREDSFALLSPSVSTTSNVSQHECTGMDSVFNQPEYTYSIGQSDEYEGLFSEITDFVNPQNEQASVLFNFERPVADDMQPFSINSPLPKDTSRVVIKLKKFKSNKVEKKKLPTEQINDSGRVNCQQVPDARITLKEVLNMENANVILDRLFEQDSDMESVSNSSDFSAPSPSYIMPSVFSPNYLPSLETSIELDDPPKRKSRTKGTASERYLRKKEQNKQAALRYRMKKRNADDELHQIIISEEEKQEKLKKTLKSLKHEVNFMKKLLREAFIIKGLVSADAFKKS